MEAEGIEPNMIMLNVLINAFGVAGRHMEALSIYDYMRESVSLILLHYIIWLDMMYAGDYCTLFVHCIPSYLAFND